ncbi:MAG TPA: hypothetical protein VF590_20985, partial [Isosphaeraceae bacterium]
MSASRPAVRITISVEIQPKGNEANPESKPSNQSTPDHLKVYVGPSRPKERQLLFSWFEEQDP